MVDLLAQSISVVTSSGVTLVQHADLQVKAGQLAVIIGPNGAGKSTLMRALAGMVVHDGTVTADGRDLSAMPQRERARLLGWLPQSVAMAWPVRVNDVVALGRFAHGASPDRLSAADQQAVDDAMRACAIADLAQRNSATLSGGEIARVHLARLMASHAPILLADEPVAALDPKHKIEILQQFRALADAGHTVLLILHDLELAARYADTIIAMADGKIVQQGSVSDMMCADVLDGLFAVPFRIDNSDGWPRPVICPLA